MGDCDVDMQEELFGTCNVVLSGGSTCFLNFKARMQHELQQLTHRSAINVDSFNDPRPVRQSMMHPMIMAHIYGDALPC